MKQTNKKLMQIVSMFILLCTILSVPSMTIYSFTMQENQETQDEIEEEHLEEEQTQPEESDSEEEQPEENQPEEIIDDITEEEENDIYIEEDEDRLEDRLTGETREVSTFEELRLAVADPEVSQVEVMNNLSRTTTAVATAIGTLNRDFLIRGNGFTINFGADNGTLTLGELPEGEQATLRIENAVTVKTGTAPLYNSTVGNSANWTLELEDVRDTSPRFAALPLGKVEFTGGENNTFILATNTNILIDAKEVILRGGAAVRIQRGNSIVFNYTGAESNPSIVVRGQSNLTITTAAGTGNNINLVADDASVKVRENSSFTITTGGTTAAASSTSNNAIRLTGLNPSVEIAQDSTLIVTTTLQKRGIGLYGNNASLLVDDSILTINAATGSAIHVIGTEPNVFFKESTVALNYSTGRAIVLDGSTPILRLNQTIADMLGTGISEGIHLLGSDALLLLDNESTINLSSAGAGTLQNMVIGNNNVNPKLYILGGSKLSVSTGSATTAAAAATNTAVNIRGANPIVRIDESELEVKISAGARRGLSIAGDNANVDITEGSTVTINALTGAVMQVVGAEPTVNFNKSTVEMNYSTGRAILLDATTGGTPVLNFNQTTAKMEGTGTSEGIHLLGSDALLSLDNDSTLNLTSLGAGTVQNIVIGNNNANPKLYILGGSTLSLGTGSATTAATATTNTAINIRGSNPIVRIHEDSTLDVRITVGARRGVSMEGDSANVDIADRSTVDITGATGDMFRVIGLTSEFSITDSNLTIENSSGRGVQVSGDTPSFIAKNSDISIEGTTNIRLGLNGANATIDLYSTNLNLISGNGHNIHLANPNSTITIAEKSMVDLVVANANNMLLEGDNNTIEVSGGTNITANAAVGDSIKMLGNYPTMIVNGENTFLHANSNVSADMANATVNLGRNVGVNGIAAGVTMEVSDGAEMIVESNLATALAIQGSDGTFNVLNGGQLHVKSQNSSAAASGAAAPVRFIGASNGAISGDHTFLIDNAHMSITKTGGTVPAVRMYGNNNAVIVQNGGQFFIDNPGNGTASNGGTSTPLGNQGIHYTEGNDSSFTVSGIGSEVEIIASSGPAIDMGDNRGEINVIDGGYFQTVGRTAGEANGIFNAGQLTVTFDNPLFMDFRNNRVGGGNIFNTNNSARLVATNSDLAVWRNGVDLDGDPDLNFSNLDYTFTGQHFSVLEYSSNPELNEEIFGANGFTHYSRLSSNNARWAIADELRVPTDADRYIYGRVSMPIGLHDSRPAWEGEANVEVEVERLNGNIETYFAVTEGHSYEDPGISIYGEEPRGGLFEIELDDFLQEGDIVRIVNVERTDGMSTEGFDNLILVEEVTTFPIVPPVPVRTSENISTSHRVLRGHSENPEVQVFATYNGEWFDTSEVEVDENGNFEIPLEDFTLNIDDEFQVFLRDNKGSAEAAGVIYPPETNNEIGNINPATNLEYHDTIFLQATIVTVDDIGPVNPVDPLDPETEVNPENPPELPEEQGFLSIDFVSRFNFGVQPISATRAEYYALPQRLLDENIEDRERPNYIQISDRRPQENRGGWELSVTQQTPFMNDNLEELKGARLRIRNAEVITAQGGQYPGFVLSEFTLTAGDREPLITASNDEGQGLWVYRFGDQATMGNSVILDVPSSANPRRNVSYSTKLSWELSAVPSTD